MIFGDPIRTVAPEAMPVTLDELKAQARVDTADEDAIMAAHLRAAVEMIEQYTGLGLITQTFTQTFSEWPTEKVPDLVLKRRPVQAVVEVSHLSASGSPEGMPLVIDASVYRVIGIGADRTPAKIRLGTNQTWPVLFADPEAITVTYRVGYGDDHNAVPELIRHAILMAAATWYGFREDLIIGSTPMELPLASRALVYSWRPPALA